MKFEFLTKMLVATSMLTATTAMSFSQELSLKGKTIGVTVVGTSHHWDLQAYQGQLDELKRLGAEVIALDAGRNDQTQVNQIQTLIAQKPDAIIQQLGNIKVLDPWLKKIRDADIPLFTVSITDSSICLFLYRYGTTTTGTGDVWIRLPATLPKIRFLIPDCPRRPITICLTSCFSASLISVSAGGP